MDLNWDSSYACTTGMTDPGSLVHSITAVSNTNDPNPDLGWFHIGEFGDAAGCSYVMIVNRACSQGPDTSAEAPEITAFINFNCNDSTAYVITDLAKGTNANDWNGYPEVTYSAPLNGTVPFTTTFKAGEGRLFKLVPTTIHNLPGLVTGDTIYQGGIRISSSIMVPDSNTMRIIAPAEIKINSGQGITVQGALNVKGYESDTVKFIPSNDTSWNGIHFRFHNSTGNFDYCKMDKVSNYGIQLDSAGLNDSLGVELNHCLIQNTSFDPIYCYKSRATILNTVFDGNDNTYYGLSNIKGNVKINSSTIKEFSINGIYADSAVSKIDSCLFENCRRYGVYIYGHPTGTYDSTIISNCTIYQTPSPESAQYGIYVYNNAKIRLANNLIRATGQGGIRLSASNARVYNNTIRNVAQYGILIENGASVTVRNCVTDTIYTGIYSSANTACYVRWTRFKNQSYGVYTYGLPNLGDSREAGNNDFAGCSSWYIRRITLVYPPPRLYAINNYYGPGIPNPNKFSDSVIYIPYLSTSPFLNPKINPLVILPNGYFLNSNYPNPFNPQTSISFNLIEPA